MCHLAVLEGTADGDGTTSYSASPTRSPTWPTNADQPSGGDELAGVGLLGHVTEAPVDARTWAFAVLMAEDRSSRFS
jgi:hypothetical protein